MCSGNIFCDIKFVIPTFTFSKMYEQPYLKWHPISRRIPDIIYPTNWKLNEWKRFPELLYLGIQKLRIRMFLKKCSTILHTEQLIVKREYNCVHKVHRTCFKLCLNHPFSKIYKIISFIAALRIQVSCIKRNRIIALAARILQSIL